MKKLYRSFTFDLTIAITALVLGIIMLPPFGIGIYALNILLAYKNGNMVYAIDSKNDDCVNIVVKDTRHGSAKQYEVEYAYES